MTTLKQKRELVATSYWAAGYGRGENKRNVYLIDGKYYAYHPKYAQQAFAPLTGEFANYVEVKQLETPKGFIYTAI